MDQEVIAHIEGGTSHRISFDTGMSNAGKIDGSEFQWDVHQVDERNFHIIKDKRSYRLELLKADISEKHYFIKVNGNQFKIRLEDRFDQLLKQLGMADLAASKVAEVKAPMPGLVLDIPIKEGQEVQKDEPLLVLEAMKMENVLKSPTDGVIKKIAVEKGEAVEKNQLLIAFES